MTYPLPAAKAALFLLICLWAAAFPGVARGAPAEITDTLILGDDASERTHRLTQVGSEVIRGGLDEPARRLLPLAPVSHNGGSISFRLKVDPERQNYLTVKLWGSDHGSDRGRLILYIDQNLQVGYRHEGDHDVLNQMDADPLYRDRFVYQTVALPISRTQGKRELTLKISSLGPMWPYGTSFKQKQKDLKQPSRAIYSVYSHTDTCFSPEASEKQGSPSASPSPRPEARGEEILVEMKTTVNSRLSGLMNDKSGQGIDRGAAGKVLLLAEAYHTPWTVAYRNPAAISALARNGDGFLRAGVIGTWAGIGPLGEAIARLGSDSLLTTELDEKIDVPADFTATAKAVRTQGKDLKVETLRLSRREAWARSLRASVDWSRTRGRRSYTNQSMIVDLGIYGANRGLRVIDPARALPEEEALRYVHESVGLRPWLGNDTPGGGAEKPYGGNYYLITRKGLSRELGYVGTYGETIFKFARDMTELTGDEKVRQQLLKIQAARMPFRYPSLDAEGYRIMKIAGEIDGRTAHFPVTNGAYGAADVRELWWMEMPAFTQDPVAIGAAQQCLEDNQYFPRLAQRLRDGDTLGMMRNVDEYAAVKALPKSSFRLPMTDGQPDFVFSDEENAVVAMKHGDRRLFLNFYFRQEFGVSGVVRILDVAPEKMRIASVLSRFELDSSGREWTRPDIIDFQRSGGIPPPEEKIHQAWQGENLPIAKRPADASQPEYGRSGPFVGKAAFYHLRYGDYLFAINTTEDKTYAMPAPAGYPRARDLVSGKDMKLDHEVPVPPLTTLVLYLGGAAVSTVSAAN